MIKLNETSLYKLTYWSMLSLALFTFISFSFTALHHIFIIVPGIYFFFKSLKERKLNISKSCYFLLALIFFAILSVFLNWNELAGPFKNLVNIKYLIFGFLSIFAFRETFVNYLDKKKIALLVNAFLVSTSFATLIGLLAIPLGFNILRFKDSCHPFRACGMYGMTITYGYGISLACILMLSLILYRNELKGYFNNKILYFSFFINLFGLYFSYARGGMLGFLSGGLVILWIYSKKLFYYGLFIGSFFIMTLIFLSSRNIIKSHYIVKLTQPTNSLRVMQAIAAYKVFSLKPFSGVGFRNFENVVVSIKNKFPGPKLAIYNNDPHLKNFKGHAHNNYFEILAGTGIFGFFSIIFWHLLWLKKSLRSPKIRVKIFAPFVMALIITGLFQSTIIDGENMFLIMGIFAISQMSHESNNRKEDKI